MTFFYVVLSRVGRGNVDGLIPHPVSPTKCRNRIHSFRS